ncbi:MAG TPA: ABC transporter ATP-binding protein [Candidatus Limnocylindrales bacterium]|jgi:ABC-2 type transport system ATP-binding protein
MSGPATPVIEVRALVKRYGGRAVVDGLDLNVAPGEIVALLGPNGAGKTTTVETIEGHRRPDAGSVRVFGLDPRRDGPRIRARCGVMLQRADLWNQARVIEAVRLFAAFYPHALDPGEVLEQVGLAERRDARYRTLSGGERQRLALALAIVGRPDLAILDEPTASMDVTARRATWDLLRRSRDDGASVLLTTHLLEEAELLADRVVIIDRGRLLAAGTPADLRGGGPGERPRLEVALRAPLAAAAVAELAALPSVAATGAPLTPSGQPGVYILPTDDPAATLREVATWLEARRIVPLALRFAAPSLEEVFLRLTGETEAER